MHAIFDSYNKFFRQVQFLRKELRKDFRKLTTLALLRENNNNMIIKVKKVFVSATALHFLLNKFYLLILKECIFGKI